MKKALVVLLAVALVFSFATSAFAFTDISAEKAATQSAINRFAAYGVVNGYPDGTFLPDGTITRAEFAKIVIVYTNNEVLADSLKNTASGFSDVKAGEWYTGYVNAAVALGYFQGMGDGTFGVAKEVTYGQVVTVLLRLAGYTDALAGSWPYNYVARATKADLAVVQAATAFDTSAAATRKDVVLMANKLLGADAVSYSEILKSYVGTGKTVTATYEVFGTTTEPTVALAVKYAAKKGFTVNDKALSENFGISDGFTLFDLVYGNLEGKVMVKNDKVAFVELDGKYVKGMVSEVSKDGKTCVIDGVTYDSSAVTVAAGKYYYATVAAGKLSAPVEKAAIGGDVITKADADGKGFATTGAAITTVAKDKFYAVFKDGALASVEDIKVGDLVYTLPTAITGTEKTYVVTSPVGAAAISGINSNDGDKIASYVIDGVTYTGAPKYIVGTAVDTEMKVAEYAAGKYKGLEGVLYKDALGYFAYMAYDQADVKESVVIGAIMDGTAVQSAAGGTSIGTGEIATYAGYADLTVLTTKGETVKYVVDSKKYEDLFTVSGTTIKTKTGNETIVKGLFVEITLDENQVIVGLKPANLGSDVTVADVDTKYNTVKISSTSYNTPATTPVFMKSTDAKGKVDVKVVDFSTLGAGLKGKTVKFVAEKYAMSYMVVENYTAVETVETYAVLKSLYQDGSNVQFEDGSIFAKTSDFKDHMDGAAVGDIVSYVLKDGKIASLSVKKKAASISDANEIEEVSGSVIKIKSGNTYVVDADVIVYIYKDKAFVEMGSAADLVNGAKVDFSGTGFVKDGVLIKQVIVVK